MDTISTVHSPWTQEPTFLGSFTNVCWNYLSSILPSTFCSTFSTVLSLSSSGIRFTPRAPLPSQQRCTKVAAPSSKIPLPCHPLSPCPRSSKSYTRPTHPTESSVFQATNGVPTSRPTSRGPALAKRIALASWWSRRAPRSTCPATMPRHCTAVESNRADLLADLCCIPRPATKVMGGWSWNDVWWYDDHAK